MSEKQNGRRKTMKSRQMTLTIALVALLAFTVPGFAHQ